MKKTEIETPKPGMPDTPEINPRPASPDIRQPGGPEVPPDIPDEPEVPPRPPEPGVSPGKTREPEIPQPAPPEPHEQRTAAH